MHFVKTLFPEVLEVRQGGSDTSPTSYGEVETVGSTSDSQSKWGRGFRDATEDDDDRPSESLKATQGGVQQDAEEAKQDVDNRFGRFKADIQAATGDLQEDLGQLDVEELFEHVADPKEFGTRGEPLFFGQCCCWY
ncbi:TPA: hypothetical protein ACH3X2_013101 [Trebouxia sp. C0005]